ncbi:hypothetical protein F1654_09455 [Alkalicaulis satelles]|uniref:HEAT repeat domain-containing protein n=1 Tax=Alkalicaulis satelles TaxID=2609175 RepID=A0A5M6ZP60_9PROT|nr:hypothetical protein [Alkalicaulis satelles]KAA5804001.1 hypothetical protein F1654_09455 [Alkalicaulis satelles]
MSWASSLVPSVLALALSAPVAASAAAQQPERRPVEVRTLEVADPFEIGAPGGALEGDAWSSGDARALRALLDVLPESAGPGWRSPAASRLAVRALLSAGEPPRSARGDSELAAMRAGRALSAGRAEPVHALMQRTPRTHESPALSRIYAETAFALGHREEGCRIAETLIRGRETSYWLRARAACQAFAGNIAAAELSAELARAQNENPAFERLFDALALERGLPENAAPMSGLQLAMAEFLAPETRITPGQEAPRWLHRAAERTGESVVLPEDLGEALEAAEAMEGALRAAALGALIQQDLDREIAAEALAIALDDAARNGSFVETASAYGIEVAEIPITADTLAHGPRFMLAALAADDIIAANAWREALLSGPPREVSPFEGAPWLSDEDAYGEGFEAPPPPASARTEPDPDWTPPPPGVLVALDFARAVATGEITGGGFEALLAARMEAPNPARLCQAAALSALGAPDGAAIRTALTGLTRDPEVPAPLIVPALLAAVAGAKGETQLHAARLIEQGGRDPEACAGAALALDRAGLRIEALRFVLELILDEEA